MRRITFPITLHGEEKSFLSTFNLFINFVNWSSYNFLKQFWSSFKVFVLILMDRAQETLMHFSIDIKYDIWCIVKYLKWILFTPWNLYLKLKEASIYKCSGNKFFGKLRKIDRKVTSEDLSLVKLQA